MNSHSILRFVKAILFLGLLQSPAVRAFDEPNSPRFGGTTLAIHGQTFVWDLGSSQEYGDWRNDMYYSSTDGSALSVLGPINNTYLATVTGNDINGFLAYGSYNDLVQAGSPVACDYYYNGTHYTTSTTMTNYSVDLYSVQLSASYSVVYSASDRSFTVTWDGNGGGTISGSENGVIYQGVMYVNSIYTSTNMTAPNGVLYSDYTNTAAYSVDNNSLITTTTEYYSAPSSGATSGYYSYVHDDGGNWSVYDTGSNPSSLTTSSLFLFGSDYHPSNTSWNNQSNSMGYSLNQTSESYATNDGGWATVSNASDNWSSSASISGWDPYAGSFSSPYSSNFNDITADPRSSPTFAPSQIWVNGALAGWQAGTITLDGTVTDSYAGFPDLVVSISGSAINFIHGTSADVAISQDSSSGSGTYSSGGQFSVSGWDVHPGEPNQSMPLFSAMTLWVDGTAYSFSYGYQDDSGNRADIYATSGGMVSIVGNASDTTTATVWVNHNGDIHTGSAMFGAGGGFSVTGVDIQLQAPGSPEAFWIGNVFYRRSGSSNGTYTSFPDETDSLTLSSTSDPAALMVTVANAGYNLTGTFNSMTGGVFMVTHDSQTLPACAAHADGTLVPSGTARDGYPPAVQMLGSIWNYLGEAAEDGAPGSTAAYYGNTRTAVYSTDPNDPSYRQPLINAAQRLLKIRVEDSDAVTVTLTNYGDSGSSTVSSYLPAARLFQVVSGASNAMTMPVMPVDPQQADIIWILHPAQELGLPASFIVHGQTWRYAGAPGGVPTYLGSYTGQQMTLGAKDDQGQRLVTVNDPVYNNGSTSPTEGTLSSVRDSVRLRDGSVVFSGNDAGVHVAVQHADDDKLQTISADLDIVGNNLSFGILQGDASLSGALFQFADLVQTNEDSTTTSIASLGSILSRPQARWQWSRAVDSSGQGSLPVMQLDAASKLTLYDHSSGNAGVVLDPQPDGVSSINGVLRVRPGGDLDMGEFTTSPTGLTTP